MNRLQIRCLFCAERRILVLAARLHDLIPLERCALKIFALRLSIPL